MLKVKVTITIKCILIDCCIIGLWNKSTIKTISKLIVSQPLIFSPSFLLSLIIISVPYISRWTPGDWLLKNFPDIWFLITYNILSCLPFYIYHIPDILRILLCIAFLFLVRHWHRVRVKGKYEGERRALLLNIVTI